MKSSALLSCRHGAHNLSSSVCNSWKLLTASIFRSAPQFRGLLSCPASHTKTVLDHLDHSEQGMTIVAVLWMLLSVVAAALALEAHSSTHIARNLAEKAATRGPFGCPDRSIGCCVRGSTP